MRNETLAESQRLAQHYKSMSDGELYALDADIADLTKVAQQVLSEEMSCRGLNRSNAPILGHAEIARQVPPEGKKRRGLNGRTAPKEGLNGSKGRDLPYSLETSVWSFDGRIGRGTFWVRVLWSQILGAFFAWIIDGIGSSEIGEFLVGTPIGQLLIIILYIAVVWISLAAHVKRWHDLGRSGWMSLLMFTVVAIPFIFIYLGFFKGTDGPNRFDVDYRKAADEAREHDRIVLGSRVTNWFGKIPREGIEPEKINLNADASSSEEQINAGNPENDLE